MESIDSLIELAEERVSQNAVHARIDAFNSVRYEENSFWLSKLKELKQSQSGMRWVKASERLPSHIFGKIARFIHTKTILYDFIEWVKNSPDRLNEVEWLDESGAEQEGWSAETVVRAVRMELFGKDNISEFDDSQKDYFYGVKGIIESAMKNFPPPNQAWRRNANPLDAHPPSP